MLILIFFLVVKFYKKKETEPQNFFYQDKEISSYLDEAVKELY